MKRYALWSTPLDRMSPKKLESFLFYWTASLVCLAFNRASAFHVAFVVPESWKPH